MKRLVSLLLAGLVFACAGEGPVQQNGQATEVQRHEEGANLSSILRGATIRDRSDETSFEYASLQAIDGHPGSAWSTSSKNLEQWLIAELPVRSRIDALGLSSGLFVKSPSCPRDVRFETSVDGAEWTEAGTFAFEVADGNQFHDVAAADARFVRVTILSNHGAPVTHLPTLLVHGKEADEWKRPSISGKWMLNDLSADLREDGRRVYGRVDMDPPMLIDGAWSDRIVRFTWARGRTFGIGLFALNEEGCVLNGMWWYENAVDAGIEFGHPWFGTKAGAPAEFQIGTSVIAQIHVERAGRYPLFGLHFDEAGNLDAEGSRSAIDFVRLAIDSFPEFRVRLEVSEFRAADPGLNLEKSRREAVSLGRGLTALGLPADRLLIVPMGSERGYPMTTSPIHWSMYSRVDFSLTASE